MHDINFFNAYRQGKSSTKGGFVFVVILLAVVLVLNGLLFGLAYVKFSEIENDIKNMQDYLANPDTISQLKRVDDVSMEVGILTQYQGILDDVTNKLTAINMLDVSLVDYIRKLTPVTTIIESSTISGNLIVLNCVSPLDTDALDMYHAFLRDPMYEYASLSSINKVITDFAFNEVISDDAVIEQVVTYSFTITAMLEIGGIDE